MNRDDDIDEALLDMIGRAVETYDYGVFEPDEGRMAALDLSYELCKTAFPDAKVKLYKNKPLMIAGHIEIVAKKIECKNIGALSYVAATATSLEIVALTNGNVRLDITFYGTSRKVGD